MINQYERYISTQVLNEFCNVSIRKLKLPIASVREAVKEMTNLCNQITINEETVDNALVFHEKYGYSYYDCLMIASALESGCKYLLSEDLSDGQVLEGSLTVKNIFASSI